MPNLAFNNETSKGFIAAGMGSGGTLYNGHLTQDKATGNVSSEITIQNAYLDSFFSAGMEIDKVNQQIDAEAVRVAQNGETYFIDASANTTEGMDLQAYTRLFTAQIENGEGTITTWKGKTYPVG